MMSDLEAAATWRAEMYAGLARFEAQLHALKLDIVAQQRKRFRRRLALVSLMQAVIWAGYVIDRVLG
jgi:hypothetical protein